MHPEQTSEPHLPVSPQTLSRILQQRPWMFEPRRNVGPFAFALDKKGHGHAILVAFPISAVAVARENSRPYTKKPAVKAT